WSACTGSSPRSCPFGPLFHAVHLIAANQKVKGPVGTVGAQTGISWNAYVWDVTEERHPSHRSKEIAMAEHINGRLYWEQLGKAGRPVVFLHPIPMDHSAWIYQMAHLSTWFRCIGIDAPGYGGSPTAR